mmetsp:Transcript_66787/g.150849  ORF Transcript_66787/g.150849 Transcript_66787/m.150849 type:complete len:215 (-) Transcript_66787:1122-1766(-)
MGIQSPGRKSGCGSPPPFPSPITPRHRHTKQRRTSLYWKGPCDQLSAAVWEGGGTARRTLSVSKSSYRAGSLFIWAGKEAGLKADLSGLAPGASMRPGRSDTTLASTRGAMVRITKWMIQSGTDSSGNRTSARRTNLVRDLCGVVPSPVPPARSVSEALGGQVTSGDTLQSARSHSRRTSCGVVGGSSPGGELAESPLAASGLEEASLSVPRLT